MTPPGKRRKATVAATRDRRAQGGGEFSRAITPWHNGLSEEAANARSRSPRA